jgi:hypothetical protein
LGIVDVESIADHVQHCEDSGDFQCRPSVAQSSARNLYIAGSEQPHRETHIANRPSSLGSPGIDGPTTTNSHRYHRKLTHVIRAASFFLKSSGYVYGQCHTALIIASVFGHHEFFRVYQIQPLKLDLKS